MAKTFVEREHTENTLNLLLLPNMSEWSDHKFDCISDIVAYRPVPTISRGTSREEEATPFRDDKGSC
jgi:hypothetical protein